MRIGTVVKYYADGDLGIITGINTEWGEYRVKWVVLSDGDGWYISSELEVICE